MENEISQKDSNESIQDSIFNENIVDEVIQNLSQLDLSDEKDKKIAELSKRGYQLMKEENFDEAEQSFEAILNVDENNNYALVGLGDIMRKKNNITEAIQYYNRCLESYPSNNYALFGLADCYKAMNQFKKAIDIWQKYLTHDENNITVITRVADAYRKNHDFKKSKEFYQEVLEIEPDNAYALIGLGHLNYDFKEYKEALYYLTRILELNSKDTVDIRVLTSIGNCHRKIKTFDQGTIYFQMALEREPKNFYALYGLADCYRGLNDPEKSIIYWNKILEIEPNNKVILTRAGDAYRTLGHLEVAKSYYNKALEIDSDIYASIGLALICKLEGKIEEAIEMFQKLIENDRKNLRLYIDLANCYVESNHKDKAEKILTDFLKFDPRNLTAKNALGKIKNGQN